MPQPTRPDPWRPIRLRQAVAGALVALSALAGAEPIGAAGAEVRIFQIQGSGLRSPLDGQRVTSSGVVTLRTGSGFFMQDPVGDADPATSDGLFVYTGSTGWPAAEVGNRVRVTGQVLEYASGADPDASLTELTRISAVELIDRGHAIEPQRMLMPQRFQGELERQEGMLVTHAGPLTIAQNHFQARYGQLTLGAGGRPETPTNRHRPGSAQALALADEQARGRIVLDDGSSAQHPDPTPYLDLRSRAPRAGDRVGPITGVIDQGPIGASLNGPSGYRIHPSKAPGLHLAHPRSDRPAPVGGTLRIASLNLQNFFTTFRDGERIDGQRRQGCRLGTSTSAGNCRGASDRAEFERQRAKVVAALTAIDADVMVLLEIQNDDGTALRHLVDVLNRGAGGRRWKPVAAPQGGSGSDAVRVAMLYRPAALEAIGASVSDPDPLNTRPTLAQAFQRGGERIVVLASHQKSKGGCPLPETPDAAGNLDRGDGQGCWNARRTAQARRLLGFAAERQQAARTDHVLLIGDLNAYAQEDPIHALTSQGFVDLLARSAEPMHSYVFDGLAGRLDHALASPALAARVTGATLWHINADESPLHDYNLEFKAPRSGCSASCPTDPYRPDAVRSSDHDPVVIGIDLPAAGPARPPGRQR